MRTAQLITAAALVAGSTQAAPSPPGSSAPLLRSRAISAELLSELEYYSQYAAAAYCPSSTKGTPGSAVTCAYSSSPLGLGAADSTSCARVEAAGATLHSGFDALSIFNQGGLVALDPTTSTVVLGIRGAAGLLAPLLSLSPSILTPCEEYCADCECYKGYYDAWKLVRDEVLGRVRDALAENPGYRRVAVAGHSLGAIMGGYAVAELAALARSGDDAVFAGITPSLYSYAGSRLGNLAFAEFLSSTDAETGVSGATHRVTHTADPVPRYGDTGAGMRHYSPEYWISYDMEPVDEYQYEVVDPAQIEVVVGYNNLTHGASAQGGYDIPAHSRYFQANIGACYSA